MSDRGSTQESDGSTGPGAGTQGVTQAPGGGHGPDDRMSPEQERAAQSPLLRALAWIGLDLTGPGRASYLQIGIYSLLVFIPIALAVSYFHLGDVWLFVTASAAIIPLAKILGTAT